MRLGRPVLTTPPRTRAAMCIKSFHERLERQKCHECDCELGRSEFLLKETGKPVSLPQKFSLLPRPKGEGQVAPHSGFHNMFHTHHLRRRSGLLPTLGWKQTLQPSEVQLLFQRSQAPGNPLIPQQSMYFTCSRHAGYFLNRSPPFRWVGGLGKARHMRAKYNHP